MRACDDFNNQRFTVILYVYSPKNLFGSE